MPGVGKGAVIIDVVAAAASLTPSERQVAPEVGVEPANLGPGPGHQVKDPSRCALGHQNELTAKFCASCGLPMGAQAPPPRLSADALRPKPADQLTDEERAERDRQHAEALSAATQFENQQLAYQRSEGEAILIHFVDDGFTFAGQVWYRGQEIEIGPDHPRWEEVLRWITMDKYQQIERYGKQYFDHGPWPGQPSYSGVPFERVYTGRDSDGNLTGGFAGPGEEALRAAEEAERRRNRAVPLPSFTIRG